MSLASGTETAIEADLVVVQTGRASIGPSPDVFAEYGLEIHSVGDCMAPRRLSHALFEAHRLAVRL